MCNHVVTSEKGEGNYYDLDKTQVKLFPNFTSISFDYLLMLILMSIISSFF